MKLYQEQPQNLSNPELSTHSFSIGSVQLEMADALSRYPYWQAPTAIISDGAYGLGLFPGDPPTHEKLAEWYEPHIAAWAKYSLPETTLWFWCNEIGWTTVHPVLEKYGWKYRAFHVWDKGIGQIAGNVNSKTIRRFPVVTEVCVQYELNVTLNTGDGLKLPIQSWLRHEWLRSGLPLSKANEASGVRNAATRKYLTQCHLWYFPPPEMMERLSNYAMLYGKPTEYPYFSLDGTIRLNAEQWSRMRTKWNHIHGVTNVWQEPSNRGKERIKSEVLKCEHSNQKPLKLLEYLILSSTDVNDVVWEPFSGLCSVSVAALRANRRCYSAEINLNYYKIAKKRLEQEKIVELSLFSDLK
jgi:DNA methylase